MVYTMRLSGKTRRLVNFSPTVRFWSQMMKVSSAESRKQNLKSAIGSGVPGRSAKAREEFLFTPSTAGPGRPGNRGIRIKHKLNYHETKSKGEAMEITRDKRCPYSDRIVRWSEDCPDGNCRECSVRHFYRVRQSLFPSDGAFRREVRPPVWWKTSPAARGRR